MFKLFGLVLPLELYSQLRLLVPLSVCSDLTNVKRDACATTCVGGNHKVGPMSGMMRAQAL
eukprot:CAMPEP_0117571620 /NCGR_PEP_ID=MMETSP0784-20121206/59855_1 /TAXON_ID=39447 /ORGANISM="" /LENGTH=60 /DNA_ID=CAMNT_0005369805 /DNA_START=90 /DNA_END=268 /DNA_ORIENTATION=+